MARSAASSNAARSTGIELAFDMLDMGTNDQLLFSALHGTAMRYAAERRNLDESIEELRQIADSRNDIPAEAASSLPGLGMPAGPPMLAMSSSARRC
jgi:hypothetical protein